MKIIDQVKLELINNPDIKNAEIATKLNLTASQVKIAKERINKEKKKDIKGIKSNVISNTKGKDAISKFLLDYPSYIPYDLRTYLIQDLGETYGRLIGYVLSQSKDDILVPQPVLAACHSINIGSLLTGKNKVNLDHADEVYEGIINHPKFNLVLSDYIPNVATRKVINHNLDSIIHFAASCTGHMVNTFTGTPLVPQQPIPSPISQVEDFRQLLLNQNLDYSILVKFSQDPARKTLCLIEDRDTMMKQLSIFNNVVADPAPKYSAVSNSCRLYTKGPSFQNLTRDIRSVFFYNKLQFDLKNAQLSIISKLWEAPEIMGYFNNRPVWATLQQETGLAKDVLKKGIYTLIFGGSYQSAVSNMAEVAGITEAKLRQKICNCNYFILLATASSNYDKKIRATKTCKDAFGQELYHETSPGKISHEVLRRIKAGQAQSYEMAIIMPAVRYLIDSKIPVWLFLHDGLITECNADVYFTGFKAIVKSKAKEFGMDIEVDCEVLR